MSITLTLTSATDALKLQWPSEIEDSILAFCATQGTTDPDGVFTPKFSGPAACLADALTDPSVGLIRRLIDLFPPASVAAKDADVKKAQSAKDAAQDALLTPVVLP